ncbi:hypothetical protein AAES_48528 [Amazona aestiva]|uniref:Guanine nucleotide-binding protein-like 3 n=1 Tax=Amazona aestiva TaxID=12930 RepID=A0A0Q3MQ15_AMAAE|nr:hypothetical protein AAES_48528 [Amazona aestiva]
MFYLAWGFVCNQLEELKQKQKLNRQKEHEKKRKLEAIKNAKIEEKAEGKGSSGKSKAKANKRLDKNSKESFCSELKKVIEASDVVLEVLDARDPMGCRCPQLEEAVTCSGGGKKLVLVLNKIDLVPKENLEKWLNYLKKELPTVAFKSATLMRDKTLVIMRYSIPDFENTEEFLALLARKRGMLKKGGVPDIENITKVLLCDWTGAKISYYSQPPESQTLPPYLTEDKIAEMQECFNFKNLEEENNNTVQALKCPSPANSIIFQSAGMANGTIVIEEASEWENLETSKEEEEQEEEEDFTESDDDPNNLEEEMDVEEKSRVQITRKTGLEKQTSPTNSGKEIAESEHSNSVLLNLDKTADEDDAYDFNTDYV